MDLRIFQLLTGFKIPPMAHGSDGSDYSDSDGELRRISLGEGKMADDDIYVLKITLNYTKPVIYRRVEVKANSTFEDLHYIIQTVMPWSDSHMHNFEIRVKPTLQNMFRGVIYIQKRDEYDDMVKCDKRDETEVISNYLMMDGLKTCTYTYDFGDNWEHKIHLEKVIKADPKFTYPRCTGGKMKCPPDDCGSYSGFYEDFFPKMTDKNHPEHEEMAEWYGEDTFDPKDFNYKEVDFSVIRELKELNEMYG